jgi:hypothetical protein
MLTSALALLTAIIVGVAAWLLAFGDKDRVGVAGTLLGGAAGFLFGWITERSRRAHEDAHRFEADRRVVYVRFLEAVDAVEKVVRSRGVAGAIKRDRPDLADRVDMPEPADTSGIALLVDEIQLLAPAFVYMSATIVRMALDTLDLAHDGPEEQWHLASAGLVEAQAEFLRRAKRDLRTPTGVMTRWQSRRYYVMKRLGLIRPRSKPKK